MIGQNNPTFIATILDCTHQSVLYNQDIRPTNFENVSTDIGERNVAYFLVICLEAIIQQKQIKDPVFVSKSIEIFFVLHLMRQEAVDQARVIDHRKMDVFARMLCLCTEKLSELALEGHDIVEHESLCQEIATKFKENLNSQISNVCLLKIYIFISSAYLIRISKRITLLERILFLLSITI